jgi:hypothetical protein
LNFCKTSWDSDKLSTPTIMSLVPGMCDQVDFLPEITRSCYMCSRGIYEPYWAICDCGRTMCFAHMYVYESSSGKFFCSVDCLDGRVERCNACSEFTYIDKLNRRNWELGYYCLNCYSNGSECKKCNNFFPGLSPSSAGCFYCV